MKWVLLTILVSIGLVTGDGAWKENQVYKYKLQSYTRNNEGGVMARARLFIYPQSNVLLIGQISQVEYDKADGQFSEQNFDLSDRILTHRLPLNKQFLIHLENGVIESISVDRTMTSDQINQLKAIVSQFQLDTKAQKLIQSEDNHLFEEDNNNAFFKTMESTATGNCETLYDISPLPNYLAETNPKWVPLPKLKQEGEFIKIEKTRNFNNCMERNGYLSYYKMSQTGYQSNSYSNSGESSESRLASRPNQRTLTPLLTRVILSGDLQNYVIQSSITTSNAEGFYDYLEVTLESVEEGTIRPMFRLESFENVGNLVLKSNVENNVRPMTYTQDNVRPMTNTQDNVRPMTYTQDNDSESTYSQNDRESTYSQNDLESTYSQNDRELSYSQNNLRAAGRCSKAEGASEQWSGCWTAFPSADTICKDAFTPEWEDVGSECCGFLCLGKRAKCRRSFPGCVSTVCYSVFVPHDTLCKDSYKDDYPVTCGGFVDCSPGFWGARCCPKSYE